VLKFSTIAVAVYYTYFQIECESFTQFLIESGQFSVAIPGNGVRNFQTEIDQDHQKLPSNHKGLLKLAHPILFWVNFGTGLALKP
jgi:hypothetical protein